LLCANSGDGCPQVSRSPHGLSKNRSFDRLAGFTAGWRNSCFNAEHLEWCLREAGFDEVERLSSERGSDHGIVNLGMSAIKTLDLYRDSEGRP